MRNEKNKDLEKRINDYFLYCDAVNESHNKTVKPYTLSGLLSYMGITKSEFEGLLKTRRNERLFALAKMKIEAFIEENALNGTLSCNASMNSLKYSFGWGEKQEKQDLANDGNVIFSMSPEMQSLAR